MTGKDVSRIIDSHCHAWPRWPYDPPVPDDSTRGSIEMLLHDMDQYGVDQALIVCAGIERNPDNNEYVSECAKRYPGRIHQAIDVDSHWSDTYHGPDAAARLINTIEGIPVKAVSHYLDGTPESKRWLVSEEGMAFFRVIADNNLILSISGGPNYHSEFRELAAEFPAMPILCPHLAGIRADRPDNPGMKEVLKSAEQRNIFIKISGLNYGSSDAWDYPYSGRQWIVRELYEQFGAERLCWGSNSPVSAGRGWMTYRQTIESVRSHCDFISDSEMDMVMGGNLAKLLADVGLENQLSRVSD